MYSFYSLSIFANFCLSTCFLFASGETNFFTEVFHLLSNSGSKEQASVFHSCSCSFANLYSLNQFQHFIHSSNFPSTHTPLSLILGWKVHSCKDWFSLFFICSYHHSSCFNFPFIPYMYSMSHAFALYHIKTGTDIDFLIFQEQDFLFHEP